MSYPAYPECEDSERVWLGDVPAHWAVRRLKFQINKVGSGVTPSGGAESYELEGVPLLRSQNVHFDGQTFDARVAERVRIFQNQIDLFFMFAHLRG